MQFMAKISEKFKKVYKLSLLKWFLSGALIFIAAVVLGYAYGRIQTLNWAKSTITSIRPVRENNFNYSFIYPLLGYDFGNAKAFF